MRWFCRTTFGLLTLLLWTTLTSAGEYALMNGSVLRGDVASINDEGIVVKLSIGGFSDRVAWGQLTQDTLKAFMANPKAKEFAEPFIEIPPAERIKRKEITIKEVARMERPPKNTPFAAAVSSPGGIFILAILMGANIYGAFEVARFRARPPAIVCGLSVVLPVVAPFVFLLMPAGDASPEDTATGPEDAAAEAAAAAPVNPMQGNAATPSSLSLSAGKHGSGPAGPDTTLYNRGDTTFNRRFFETKYSGLFRVVPSEAEKDLVLALKTTKGDFVAKRISRISMAEMHIIPAKAGAEASIPFSEIVSAQLRHKDAR